MGVALIIGPWNYPLQLLLGPLVGAIAAGNCAVEKASEFAPHTAAAISKLIGKIFPAEFVAVVEGDASVATALLAVNRAPEAMALLLALMALAALWGFLWRSRRAARPIIDLGLFRRKGFAALNLAHAMVSFAAFAVMLIGPFYLAKIAGFAPVRVGLLLACSHGAAALGSALGGWASGRWDARRLAMAGAGLTAAGLLGMTSWDEDTPDLALALMLAIQGLGTGLFTLACTDVVTGTMRREDRGVAGSLTMLTRTLGVVGAASLVTLAFAGIEAASLATGAAPAEAFSRAFSTTFVVVGALPIIALLLLRGVRS